MITPSGIAHTDIMINYVFNLKRTLLYLYQDNLITTSLIDGLYDFIQSKGNITYFSFHDDEKSMIYKIKPNLQFVDLYYEIRNYFVNFVLNTLRNSSLQYLLQKDAFYVDYLSKIDDQSIVNIAQYCITILNISTDQNEITIKINLLD